MRTILRSRLTAACAVAMLTMAVAPTTAGAGGGFLTQQQPFLALDPSAPAGSQIVPIINSGDRLQGGFVFEGVPDGIGVMPGDPGTLDAFVNHEQTHVPFGTLADIEDASVSRLTLDVATGAVLSASVPIPPRAGFLRFCSSFMAGPDEGFADYTYFTGEEAPDVVPVPTDAVYGPDPSLAPDRQAGYAVALDPETGTFDAIAGMGRHNHENSIVVPGGWGRIAVLSGDDTFSAPSSQLYMYLAGSEQAIWNDTGTLYAFRVTATDEGPVDATDPFNGANDYGDISAGDDWSGRFIEVPENIAKGLTGKSPQTALEDWSNNHNVFQFIRIEDTAYDVNNPRIVYLADTGSSSAVPDPSTGRLTSGSGGQFTNGRIFRIRFDEDRPRSVVSFRILLNADRGRPLGFTPMHQPDNMDTSANSLMVQEDTSQAPFSRIWRYDLATKTWSVVASVIDQQWESSGVVDVSEWFGPGSWLVDVQAHDIFVRTEPGPNGITLKREAGQLLLLRIPGS